MQKLIDKRTGKCYDIIRENESCVWLKDESGKVLIIKKKWLNLFKKEADEKSKGEGEC